MMDDGEDILEPPGGKKDNTIALFLGLYLLILAFFILLVSISSLEEVRTQQIMDSLSSTFTTILPPSTKLTPFQKDEGDVIAGQAFQERITGIFATTLQIAKVDVVQPGRLMKVSLPTRALFEEGEVEMRDVQLEILDRIVAALSARPAGVRYDLEFVIGSEFIRGTKNLPVGETLEMGRAGAFAREMLSRGVPPDSVSVGMRKADPTQVDLWFHTREQDEAALRFDHLLKELEGAGDEEAAEPENAFGISVPAPTGSQSVPSAPASIPAPSDGGVGSQPDGVAPAPGFVLPLPPGATPGGEPAAPPAPPTPDGSIQLPVQPQAQPDAPVGDGGNSGGIILLPPRPSGG